MFAGFFFVFVLSNYYCGFSVFTEIFNGFPVSNRPQCPPLKSLYLLRLLNERFYEGDGDTF